jgi:hypothetical protein
MWPDSEVHMVCVCVCVSVSSILPLCQALKFLGILQLGNPPTPPGFSVVKAFGFGREREGL